MWEGLDDKCRLSAVSICRAKVILTLGMIAQTMLRSIMWCYGVFSVRMVFFVIELLIRNIVIWVVL